MLSKRKIYSDENQDDVNTKIESDLMPAKKFRLIEPIVALWSDGELDDTETTDPTETTENGDKFETEIMDMNRCDVLSPSLRLVY